MRSIDTGEEGIVDRIKEWAPTAVMAIAAAAMLAHGPIAQYAHYHEFADGRALLGLHNAADVLSNVGFAMVGSWGLWALQTRRPDSMPLSARDGYYVFAVAIALTAFGSSFYHLGPDNDRLLWDRLPIALACAGLLGAVRAETHVSQPRWVVPALVVAAIASVAWWSLTDSITVGDLRPYLLLQGAPLVLIPLWQWIARAPRQDRLAFGIAILLYALAKIFEVADHQVFEALGFMSGHTIKHLLATAAAAVLTANLVSRLRASKETPCFPTSLRSESAA